ncbi:MAG: DUF1080 domain-containing protein, partial [Planctomycetes bacterium]|nr:DUF1080 domain-containing protein [Planctomycetota bacterium]
MVLASAMLLAAPPLLAADAEEGFVSLFNGKDLSGWDGDPGLWSVQDGAITARTTAEKPLKQNSFIIWRRFTLEDFELRLSYRIVGGNSGIQFRSWANPDWVSGGYQADIEAGDRFSGILYEERGRGILADRGQKVRVAPDGKKEVIGSVGDAAEIGARIKKEDWNDYVITARGNHIVQKINGVTTIELIDEQKGKRSMSGLLALQAHVGPPMTVQFKDIRVKRLFPEGKKKVVLLGGPPSHGIGDHEHNAGVMLFARCLNEVEGVHAVCYLSPSGRENWPDDPKAFDGADAVVIYSDGGGGHPFLQHLDEIDRLAKKGVGIGCIHYAVEVP